MDAWIASFTGTDYSWPGTSGNCTWSHEKVTQRLTRAVLLLSVLALVGCQPALPPTGVIVTSTEAMGLTLTAKMILNTPKEKGFLVSWKWLQPAAFQSGGSSSVMILGVQRKDWVGQLGAASERAAEGGGGDLYQYFRAQSDEGSDGIIVSMPSADNGWVVIDFQRGSSIPFPKDLVLVFGTTSQHGTQAARQPLPTRH